MGTNGFAAFVEKCIGLLNFVIEECQRAKASMVEMREATSEFEKLLPRQAIHDYWHQEWPSGKYPTADEWARMRDEIASGGIVLAQVGANKPGDWVQLVELSGEPEPASAQCTVWLKVGDPALTLKPGGDARCFLCPAYGPNPKNAIWRVRILATRAGA